MKLDFGRYAFINDSKIINNRTFAKMKEYFNSGVNDGTIKKFGKNYFDVKSLAMQVNLDCFNCHKVMDVLCCDGVGFPPFYEDCEKVYKLFPKILREMCSDKLYHEKMGVIMRYGLFTYSYDRKNVYNMENYYSDRTFRLHDGKCIFSVPVEIGDETGRSGFKCAIHGYALNNGLDVFDVKPRACQLFPIDVITINDEFDFVFGCNGDTAFNRWGEDVGCIKLTDAKELYESVGAFNPDDYKPLFLFEQNFLIHVYGKEIIPFLAKQAKKV